MRDKISAGTTSYSAPIYVTNSSTGAGLGSLAYNTAGLVGEYRRAGQATWTAITLAAGTLGTYSSGGWIADGSLAGAYEVGIPNAALASGAAWVAVRYYGAASMSPVLLYIELDAVNYQNAVNLGLSNLDAAVSSRSTYAGGAVASVTGNVGGNVVGSVGSISGVSFPANFGTLSIDTSGRVDLGKWLGSAPPTPGVAGVPIVDVRYDDGKANSATAQAGTSTTITLAAGEPTTISYAGQYIGIVSGTGIRQTRYVTSSAVVNSAVVLTVEPAWDVVPDATSVYQLGGFGHVTVAGYSNTATIPAPRDITGVADASLTPADVAWASIALVGRQDASSGTSLIFASPGGTTIRTSPVATSATNPYGSNYPVKRT